MKFEAKEVTFQRDQGFQLGPLTLDVHAGQCLGVLGENGSGKSTLLNLIVELRASTGQVSINGENLNNQSPPDRAKAVALVPQTIEFGLDFTVFETILLGRTPHLNSLWESKEDLAIAEQQLLKLNLTNLKNKKLSEVSGGERQRTMIARALAQEPQLLLLDEPTAHLDVRYHGELAQIIQSLMHSQIGLIITSHEINWLSSVADKVLILKSGKKIAQGPTPGTINAENLEKAFGVPFTQFSNESGQTIYQQSAPIRSSGSL